MAHYSMRLSLAALVVRFEAVLSIHRKKLTTMPDPRPHRPHSRRPNPPPPIATYTLRLNELPIDPNEFNVLHRRK